MRSALAAADMTQAEAARRLATTEATISRLLSGHQEITDRWLDLIVTLVPGWSRENSVVIDGDRRIPV